MITKCLIATMSLSLALTFVGMALAEDGLYTVSSHQMGITQFDFTITEIKREPRISTLKIPGFHDRSAGASRWMMCAYTDLAIKRGFKFWAALYPDESSDIVQLGFPSSDGEDLKKTLGPQFIEDSVVFAPVDTFAAFCGISIP